MALNPINNKKSVLAIVKETVEGTPVRPSAATDYTALQDGFSMTPSFETLQNAEIQASIGRSKDELGAENPTLNFSHYVKASGVVGQKPDFGLLIESCLGEVKVDGAERDLVAGSTASVLNVDAGEGVNYERGQAVLPQVSGAFQIRNVLSVATDALTLAQQLSSSPAANTLIGRAILYKVINEGHPTLTIWNYRGNGGLIEMMSGARVTEMSIEANANQYINGSFTINGVSYYFNPIKITSTNKYVDYEDDTGNHSISVAEKEYKDPHQLAEAIQAAIDSLSPSDAITVSYDDSTGKYTFAAPTATVFKLEFATGTNNANSMATTLGFTATDKTGALTYTSNNALSWASPYSPDLDNSSANVAKGIEVLMGDSDDTACFGAQSVSIRVGNTKTDVPDLCEESGKAGSVITGREVTIDVVARIEKHNADRFKRFRNGDKTMFTMNWGVKSGGQWVKGKCVNAFVPTASITSFEIQDQEGLAILRTSLTAYVEDGAGEFYLNFI
jgi:hypothetical protein